MLLDEIKAFPVLNSSGEWTIKVVAKAGKLSASAIVPGGHSVGIHEKRVIRYFNAIRRIRALSKKLAGNDLADIDSLIRKEAGNVSTGISIAVCRLMALESKKPVYAFLGGNKIPLPHFNIINGGVHAGNNLAFQEFMIAPRGKTYRDSLVMASEIYHHLKAYLKEKYGVQSINVGLEGGFAPPMKNVEEALKAINKVTSELGYYEETDIAIDAAASQFYSKGRYHINGKRLAPEELLDYYEKLINEYNIKSMEDPFYEEDFQMFSRLAANGIRVVGDDLTVTNPKRIARAIDEKACNSLLVKINQVGTVSEAIKACNLASSHGFSLMVSHRSGDSCDPFIADFAVGINAEFIKSGAPARGERVSKYNRLLEIEEELGK